jgi:hypothetical protein
MLRRSTETGFVRLWPSADSMAIALIPSGRNWSTADAFLASGSWASSVIRIPCGLLTARNEAPIDASVAARALKSRAIKGVEIS